MSHPVIRVYPDWQGRGNTGSRKCYRPIEMTGSFIGVFLLVDLASVLNESLAAINDGESLRNKFVKCSPEAG